MKRSENKKVKLGGFGSCLGFLFLSMGKERFLCRQYSNLLLPLNIFASMTDIKYQEPVCLRQPFRRF